MMEEISKNILYVSYTCQVKNTARMNAPLTALFGDSVMQEQIRKHSTLFNDSSDSDGEVRNTDEVVVTDSVPAVEFFEAFVNKFTDKDTEYRVQSQQTQNSSEKTVASKLWQKQPLISIWMTQHVLKICLDRLVISSVQILLSKGPNF